MAKIHVFHDNRIDTAILSGGSWRAALPLEYLREQRPSLKARSVDTLLTSTQFRLQLTAPLTSMGIQFISTNLSNAARYKISWYTDQTYTSLIDTTDWQNVGSTIDWSDTGQWLDWLDQDFWLGSAAFVDPDNQGRDVRHRFNPSEVIQYILVEIDDVSNSDGYVEIGYLYVGEAYVPSVNVQYEPAFRRISKTSMQETAGGAANFNRRGSQRSMTVAFMLPRDEVMTDIDDIVQIHDIDKPVFVDFDPENVTFGAKTAYLARLKLLPEDRFVNAFFETDAAATLSLEFIQVI